MGNICSIIAFTFLAPLPFVPTNTAISVMNICTAVQGIGVALTNVSAFTRAQMAAQRLGFNQDLKTYIMISGNSNSDCNLIKANDRGYEIALITLLSRTICLGPVLGELSGPNHGWLPGRRNGLSTSLRSKFTLKLQMMIDYVVIKYDYVYRFFGASTFSLPR